MLETIWLMRAKREKKIWHDHHMSSWLHVVKCHCVHEGTVGEPSCTLSPPHCQTVDCFISRYTTHAAIHSQHRELRREAEVQNATQAMIGQGNCSSKRIGWGVQSLGGHTGSVHLALYLCSAAPHGSWSAGRCSKHLHRNHREGAQRWKKQKNEKTTTVLEKHILGSIRSILKWTNNTFEI